MNAPRVKTIAVSINGKTKDVEVMCYGVEDNLSGLVCNNIDLDEAMDNTLKMLETMALELTVRLGRVVEKFTTEEQKIAFINFFEEMDRGNLDAKIPSVINGQPRKEIAKIVRKLRVLKEQPETLLKGAVSKSGDCYKFKLWYDSSENMLVSTTDTTPVFCEQAQRAVQEEMIEEIEKAKEAEVVSVSPAQRPEVILIHPAVKPIVVSKASVVSTQPQVKRYKNIAEWIMSR